MNIHTFYAIIVSTYLLQNMHIVFPSLRTTRTTPTFKESGFLLPGVIIVSLAITIFATASLSMIASTSSNLNSNYHQSLAERAAQAGVNYALSCIRIHGTVTWTSEKPLVPNSDCYGTVSANTDATYVAKQDNWESTFSVPPPTETQSPYSINANASVNFSSTNTSIPSVTSTFKAVAGTASRTSGTISKISVGGNHTCATSLTGTAYCWGNGFLGQLGNSGFLNITNTLPSQVSRLAGLATNGASSITTGESHSCAMAGTEPMCWGKGVDGQIGGGDGSLVGTSAPANVIASALGGRTMTKIAAGKDHTCGIASGKAYCWGHNQRAQLGNNPPNFFGAILPPALSSTPSAVLGAAQNLNVTDITAGEEHGCAVAEGSAYCWGNGGIGQVGNNSTNNTVLTSVLVQQGQLGGRAISSISGGFNHTCAIAEGELFCWGGNSRGQLGIGTTTNPTTNRTPRNVSAVSALAGKTVTKVVAAQNYTCAIADNRLYCWGANDADKRQLGIGSAGATTVNSPTIVNSGDFSGRAVTDVGAYFGHTCAVADNFAFCWGRNPSGELGTGNITASAIPQMISTSTIINGGRTASSISMGFNHTCAVSTGQPLCWGGNISGQLGNGVVFSGTNTSPIPTAGTAFVDKSVTKISASFDSTLLSHTCAIANSEAYCWGNNTIGQVGRLTGPGENLIPEKVNTTTGLAGKVVTDISAGTTHSCAVADGRAYCWGSGIMCQLGNGTCLSVNVNPVAVTTGSGDMGTRTVSAVSAGQAHSCAIANGRAYCWGNNDVGSLGTGNTTNSSVPREVSRLPLGLLGKTVTDISTSVDSTCVVADGGAYCWGNNTSGRLGTSIPGTIVVPSRVLGGLAGKNVTKIAAGRGHSCAIADAQAYCWGNNSAGQLGNGNTTSTNSATAVVGDMITGRVVTDITVGVDSTCMIADGKPFCWGSNSSGQLGDTTVFNSLAPKLVSTFEGGTEINPEQPVFEQPNFDSVIRY